jgi:hypothetical protein
LADIINNAPEELLEICEGKIACVIDGVTMGTEAADIFMEDEENIIADPSLNETTLGTTSSDLFIEDDEDDEDDSPSPPAGSLGDPHCKYYGT